jgi:putative sigma-54 modulation protein
MHLTVTARSRVDPELRSYAVQKLQRLERHDGRIHMARAVLEEDEHRVPRASVEVFVHLHHTRLMAHSAGDSLREAIDRVADKIDRQILTQKERVKQHKGHAAAGSTPDAPAPRHVAGRAGLAVAEPVEPVAADPVAARRSVALRPMAVAEAVARYESAAEPFLLFLDEEEGELCLLWRRADGELELVVGDAR